MKKKNNIWVKITAVAFGLLAILAILGKIFGLFGTGYEMVKDIQKIPKIEARIDTVEVKQQIQGQAIQRVDQKMDLLLTKWRIPIPSDTN